MPAMPDDVPSGPRDADQPESVTFHYIKSPLFRVLHVDGVIGGVTPRGRIHCAVFSERPAIPQSTEQAISPEGQLGDLLRAEGRQGIVREIDADLQLDKTTAVQLRDWLTDRINELEALTQQRRQG